MTRQVRSVSMLAALCVILMAALDAATASAATRGFYIRNFTGATLKLHDVQATGREPVFEEPSESAPLRPQSGDLLSPGEVMHVELYDQFSNTAAQLYRRVVRLNFQEFPTPTKAGPNRTFQLTLVTGDRFGPANQVVMRCAPHGSSQCPVNGTTAEMLDPPGTHITIPATDRQAQGAVLGDVCTKEVRDAGGTCKFDPKKKEDAVRPDEPVSDPVINCSHKEIEVEEEAEHKVGTTNSVEYGVAYEVGFEEAGLEVKTTVEFKYGHKWIEEHIFKKEIPVPIEPQHKGWVDHAAPVVRFTGNFTVALGNTSFTLTDIYFDHPNTGKLGSFLAQEDKATAAELKSCAGGKKLVRLPQSAVRVTRNGTAGPDNLIGGPETDALRGLGGSDIIAGGGGADRLVGGPGNDLLVGGAGHDVLDGGPGADMIIDTAGPALVQTGLNTGPGWDFVYVRDGRADDTVICGSRHTYVVADRGDRVRGHCGVVIRRGPIDHTALPVEWQSL